MFKKSKIKIESNKNQAKSTCKSSYLSWSWPVASGTHINPPVGEPILHPSKAYYHPTQI